MIASRVGVVDAVRVLLDRGAVVDTRDKTYQQTALMIAVSREAPYSHQPTSVAARKSVA